MFVKPAYLIVFAALTLPACASIIDSKHQDVAVAATYQGQTVPDSQCSLQNDEGNWQLTAPNSVVVRKSYDDMTVSCQRDGYPTGTVTLVSKANMPVWGNIVFGGIIGYIVDRSTGAGFDYPKNVTVALGETSKLKN